MSTEKRFIVLLNGLFDPKFFTVLKERKPKSVFILEGRPTLEQARVLSKELINHRIKPTLIADNMAGFLFFKDMIQEVWLSYELIDPNGALCPMGSLILAVLAKRHNVRVCLYPSDQQSKKMGKAKDIFYFNGARVAPNNIHGYVPLVEWVPSRYLTQNHEPAKH